MDVPEVNCTEAVAMREAGATWIDVRELDEWNDARIEGTRHIPLAQAMADVPAQFPDMSSMLVISCLSGGRSGQLVAQLRACGYSDVHNLRGGIKAWADEGRAVIAGD